MQRKSFFKIWLLSDNLREIDLYKVVEGPITTLLTLDCDWALDSFIEANLAKLTYNNQIFGNDFVSINYHLCKISTPIIENKFLSLCFHAMSSLQLGIYSLLCLAIKTC